MCWVKIHRQIFNEEWAHKANTLAVYVYLLAHAEYTDGDTLRRGEILTTVAEISDALNLTPKQVRTALLHLTRANETANKRANGWANAKTIITLCKYDGYESEKEDEGKRMGKQKGNDLGKEERISPNNIYNNPTSKEENILKEDKEKERVVNTTSKKGDSFNFDGIDPILLDKFKEFLQMRRKIGKPLKTQQGVNARINELNKLSDGDIDLALAIIQQSIDNEWQSFYSLKTGIQNNKTTTRYERSELSKQQFHQSVAESIQRDWEREQNSGREDSEIPDLVW